LRKPFDATYKTLNLEGELSIIPIVIRAERHPQQFSELLKFELPPLRELDCFQSLLELY